MDSLIYRFILKLYLIICLQSMNRINRYFIYLYCVIQKITKICEN